MLQLDQVLVVDGSRFVRDLLARLLRRHAQTTFVTDDCDEARRWIETNPSFSLVICDLEAPGGGGLALLEFVSRLPGTRPRVLLMGRRFDARVRTQARRLGAVGCVAKPISLGAITRAVAASTASRVSPRRYASPPARAHLLEVDEAPGAPNASPEAWNVHDLSASGALLDTRGPIPVGTPLRIALCVGGAQLRLDCRVVRVQEPSWETLPGVGIRFVGLTPDQRAALDRELERLSAPGL